MRHTAHEQNKVVKGIAANAGAAGTTNGPGIDTRGFEELLCELNAGVFTATGTLDVKLQESSDDGVGDAYVDIAGAAFSQKTDATDDTLYVGRLDLRGANRERYIRVVGVAAVAAAPYAVNVSLSEAKVRPVTQPATVGFNV